jgi:hypothetical protein
MESIVETWSISVESRNHPESLTFLTLVYLRQLASSFNFLLGHPSIF